MPSSTPASMLCALLGRTKKGVHSGQMRSFLAHYLRIKSRDDVLWLSGIVVFAGLLASILPVTPVFTHAVEMWARDLRIAIATPPEPQNDEIVIIGLTDETLDTLPYRLPVDRDFMADLIEKLDAAGVRAIGIDSLYDRKTEPAKDERLRNAIRNAKAPVIPIWADETFGVDGERLDILQDFIGDGPSGHGVIFSDRFDRTARRHKPVWDPNSPHPYQFPAAIADILGVPFDTATASIAWRGNTIEGDSPFKLYPAHWVSALPAEWFSNKIALIGVDLVDIDRHRTPFNVLPGTPRMSGIEIHAHALAQLLEGRTLWTTGFAANFVIGVVAGLIGIVLALIRSPLLLKLATGAAVILLFWILCFVMYRLSGPLVPMFMPALAFVTAIATTSVFDGRREREKRAFIRGAFARYVPPGIVARLDQDPSRLQLGGERRTLTVIFTDLAGFTSFSESLDAKMLAEVINDYLDGVAGTILRNGGTIDKFVGDGTMSFFGAPESQSDDFNRAVTCATEIDAFSEAFSKKWSAQGYDVGETRIGVFCGPAVVGNFGGKDRFDYTALGNTVNTAARLESANKFTGTRILIGSDGPLPETSHVLRPVGKLVLAGKSEPILAFEPAAETSTVKDYLSAYELLESKSPEGLAAFEALHTSTPDDPLVSYHLDRLKSGDQGTTIILKGK